MDTRLHQKVAVSNFAIGKNFKRAKATITVARHIHGSDKPLLLIPVSPHFEAEPDLFSDAMDNKDTVRISEISAFMDQSEHQVTYFPVSSTLAFAIRFLHSDKLLIVSRHGKETSDAIELIRQVRDNLGEPIGIFQVGGAYLEDGSPLMIGIVARHSDEDKSRSKPTKPRRRNTRPLVTA